MSEEPASPPDLAAIDLSLSFAPSWAKETDTSKQIARLAAKHGGGEDRGDKRSGGKRWEDRGPRPDRGPRRDGGGRGNDKRPDRARSGRPNDRDRRPEREARPEPPQVQGWNVQFLPDRRGVDGVAKQIKTSATAYPLFDLARLVLEKSERYHVEFKRTAPEATALFQLRIDGSLWLTESDAIAQALARHLDKFYRRERIAVDPPKGAYAFVAVCGMSGTVLGPPNYHDYQAKIRQLHAEKFSNMPFEAFKSRIRMDRDEEMIAKWKEEQSSRDVFYPIEEPAPAAPEQKAPEATEVPTETPAIESAEPTVENPEIVETVAAEEAAEVAAAEIPEVTPPAEEAASEPTPEEPEVSTPAADALPSLADVERHFRENHAAKAVIKIRDRVVAPGPAALNDSAPGVLRLTRSLWEDLDRFPLPLAHSLGQQLTGRGLQIFKAHENLTYVGVARARYLDRQATPVSESLGAILDYLEGHASTPRAEQFGALIALRPAPAEGAEDDRAAAVARDLSWLLHEGHVIDYAKRNLEAARRPKPPAPRPEKKRTATTPAENSSPVAEIPPAEVMTVADTPSTSEIPMEEPLEATVAPEAPVTDVATEEPTIATVPEPIEGETLSPEPEDPAKIL